MVPFSAAAGYPDFRFEWPNIAQGAAEARALIHLNGPSVPSPVRSGNTQLD